MKKLVLAALAAALLPTLAFAQGTLSYGTANPATQYFQYAPGNTRATNTTAILWWSPDGVVAFVPIGTNSVTVNGWLTTASIATTGAATPAGNSAFFYISGVSGAYTGRTPNFQNATGNPAAQPPTNPATLDGWAAPVTLVVPEPSTFALAGLGAAALLLFRRRK